MTIIADYRSLDLILANWLTVTVLPTGAMAGKIRFETGGALRNFGVILDEVRFLPYTSIYSAKVYNAGDIITDYGSIVNRGLASGQTGPTNFELVNVGRIHSFYGAALEIRGGGQTVVNSGQMTSGGASVIALGILDAALVGRGLDLTNLGLIANQDAYLNTRVAIDMGNIVNTDDCIVNGGTIIGDVILGGGADVFDGRGGRVDGRIFGGRGNDLFIIDDAATDLVEAAGEGNDTVQAWVDFTQPLNVEVMALMGAAVRGTGNGQVNQIIGNDQDNVIAGLGGNDQLFGALGNDTILGGAGNDLVFGGEGDDVLSGGDGSDSLLGQDGYDRLHGHAGADSLSGDAGQDTLIGGAGNDSLFGGADDDVLRGGADNDALDGGEGDDLLLGGAGNDTLFGVAGEDTLMGGAGQDRLDGGNDDDLLDGGAGNDTLFGRAGNDTLLGGAGNDVLEGGFGADLLDGGAGFDSFVFRARGESYGQGIDTIRGFQPGEDVIDLSRIDANTLVAGRQAFTYVFTAPFSGTAGELRVEVVPGQRIVMADVDGDRTADFVLYLEGTPILAASSFIL